ncbi:hypothetical protein BY458DRAFT_530585 [Sporodiniella umbellata]|nr:hypothetical protein BY458DRAFT_530585 [Sporodiniella umbellata]
MKSVFAAILALAAATVSAQGNTNIVSITSPLTGTVYTAGKTAIISWVPVSGNSATVIPKITLAKGASTSLQPLGDIATNVQISAGTYSWNIPADTQAGTDYALEFGQSPNISFTGQFTIKAADGSANTGSTASSSAANSAKPQVSASAAPGQSSSAAASPAPSQKSAGLKVSANQAAAGVMAVAAAAMLM